MSDTRKILHVDMDAFYASVEQRDRPELRGRPVVVGWAEAARGVVCAASYEARAFGVRSAMPIARARKLCPEGIFVRPDFTRYREVSSRIRSIFLRHTPLVEPLSLDEAYLDVTSELTGLPSATAAAHRIREEIREETGLSASAGVAPNKFLAKIASDWNKPDGMFVIRPHQVDAFLRPLEVTRLPGVGSATEKLLLDRGIVTVGDLLEVDREALGRWLGKFGERLWELARGIDPRAVVADRKAKQMSSETTFETDVPIDRIASWISEEAGRLWESVARSERAGRTVTVKLRAADFTTATRQATPPALPRSAADLREIARALLDRFDFPPGSLYRLAGIGVSNFLDEIDDPQTKLFD
ncbi:MAG TPA: DNA polymerase IV [Thermoanaerobaculia bacterium]|nr:DNA polymerase IV [Thermoanaerobaculia bacterium]